MYNFLKNGWKLFKLFWACLDPTGRLLRDAKLYEIGAGFIAEAKQFYFQQLI